MANELYTDGDPGITFFACRFNAAGGVLLSDGASVEAWGTGGRDAEDYGIVLAAQGSSGHFVGDFDPNTNIGAGLYKVPYFIQSGSIPQDIDILKPYAVQFIEWSNSNSEITLSTLSAAMLPIANLFILQTTVGTAISNVQFILAAGTTGISAYDNAVIGVLNPTTGLYELRRIAYYDGNTRTVTVNLPFTFTPVAGDTVQLSGVATTPPSGGWW